MDHHSVRLLKVNSATVHIYQRVHIYGKVSWYILSHIRGISRKDTQKEYLKDISKDLDKDYQRRHRKAA